MYYQILFDDENTYGVAYLSEEQQGNACFPPPGIFQLPYTGVVKDWKRLTLELQEGDFADYLSSNLGCRLCSDRLRCIFQACASPHDEFQWLAVDVCRAAETRAYWILHFPNPPEVLDRKQSIAAGDFIVKPVLSNAATICHHVFSYPKAGALKLFVAESVKRAINAASCTGMEFSPAPIR
ncbi:MAG: imm11 family protein [Planctomyces sp.]|jgi:hypothetical protein